MNGGWLNLKLVAGVAAVVLLGLLPAVFFGSAPKNRAQFIEERLICYG